jgi:hypothetical protein
MVQERSDSANAGTDNWIAKMKNNEPNIRMAGS